MPHHTVAQNNDLLKAAEDLTDFFGREPAHIASSRHVGRIQTDPPTIAHSLQEGLAGRAERVEWGVEIERGDIAVGAVFVRREGVDRVRKTMGELLGGLESSIGQEGRVEK